MKTTKSIIATVFIMFALLQNGKTQSFWEWTPPVPLTDSISDNANPFLFLYDNYDVLLMVWEKPIDSTTTAIYIDNILDADPPEEVLQTPGVQYTNPQIIDLKYFSSDSAFLLIYESNQNGNIDIYCKPYLEDGYFIEAVPLTTSPYDEDQFTIGKEDTYWVDAPWVHNIVAYIRNDSLFVQNLIIEFEEIFFQDEILIDAPNCRAPVGGGEWGYFGLTYLKKETGEYHIFLSRNYYNGIWSTPELIYDSADCRNINRALHYGDLVWSAYIDTAWRIKASDNSGNFTYSISRDKPFNPAALGQVGGVKSWYTDLWIATPYSVTNTIDIYMTDGPGNPDFYNFTLSDLPNRNPQFYSGESSYSGCFYEYLIWELHRNGHWQIWCSKTLQCAGNMNENNLENSFIKTQPNPFTNQTTLEFTLQDKSKVSIDIYNNQGVHVSSVTNQSYDPGTHQLRWNPEGLASGIYIVKVNVGDKMYSAKVIKADR